MNWLELVGDVSGGLILGAAIYTALSLAWAVRRWIRAQADKAESEAVRIEAEAALRLAKARSLDADTDAFAPDEIAATATLVERLIFGTPVPEVK